MELIQWILIFCLGGWIAWLHRGRQTEKTPSWLRDLQPDDLITRSDLDQYHLRVIQMSQAQRDHLNSRLEETLRDRGRPASEVTSPLHTIDPQLDLPFPPLPVVEVNEEGECRGGISPPIRSAGLEKPNPAPPLLVSNELDAPSRTITLFQEGKTIDQIAQEMRIGRQEVQLLIRMAQHQKPSYSPGRDDLRSSLPGTRSHASTLEG